MTQLVNELSRIVSNEAVGPNVHLLVLEAPTIAHEAKPGQFVHVKIPLHEEHVLRRPFCIYGRSAEEGTIDVLYQEVGSLTKRMPFIKSGFMEVIGPVGKTWSARQRFEAGEATRALLVGGGLGAAPLYLLAEDLASNGMSFDVVLGAATSGALVSKARFEALMGHEPYCATDDGTYGHKGFCTGVVEQLLEGVPGSAGAAYDYIAVCGPEPLMRIVAALAADAGIYCEVSLEKRMACGIGACLSCVVDTAAGKKRACVDGPVFDAQEVMW